MRLKWQALYPWQIKCRAKGQAENQEIITTVVVNRLEVCLLHEIGMDIIPDLTTTRSIGGIEWDVGDVSESIKGRRSMDRRSKSSF